MKVIHRGKAYTVEVAAGAYMVGDPCYSIEDDDWWTLLSSCNYFSSKPIGEVRGTKVLAFSAAYRNGCYFDQSGNKYVVDSGMIGLIPCQLATKEYGLARLMVFDKDFICKSDGQGLLTFGTIQINTGEI
jgi:hypothetical protein